VIETPPRLWAKNVCHVYSIRTRGRDTRRAHMTERHIQTAIHYPVPVQLQEAYRELGGKNGDFRVSEPAAATVLLLPRGPMM
jgi:dTDP-4-amino-4,6-dideoxygalactose transaminase